MIGQRDSDVEGGIRRARTSRRRTVAQHRRRATFLRTTIRAERNALLTLSTETQNVNRSRSVSAAQVTRTQRTSFIVTVHMPRAT